MLFLIFLAANSLSGEFFEMSKSFEWFELWWYFVDISNKIVYECDVSDCETCMGPAKIKLHNKSISQKRSLKKGNNYEIFKYLTHNPNFQLYEHDWCLGGASILILDSEICLLISIHKNSLVKQFDTRFFHHSICNFI